MIPNVVYHKTVSTLQVAILGLKVLVKSYSFKAETFLSCLFILIASYFNPILITHSVNIVTLYRVKHFLHSSPIVINAERLLDG